MNDRIEAFPVDSPLRLQGVGGSEVGSALGINPYCSPSKLYKIKIGELVDDSNSDAAELGHVLEPWILDKYEQKHGVKLERPGDRVYRHSEHPWLFAHVDGLVIGEKRGVDAKSTGLMNYQAAKKFGKGGTDHLPESIICQCVLYMAIFDYPQWDVAALIAGGGVRFYQIYRDIDLEKVVIEQLKTFWFHHVGNRIPPEPKNIDDVNVIYTNGDHDPIEATPEIYKAYLDLLKSKKKFSKVKKEKERNEFIIKEFMRDHGALLDIGDNELITWFRCKDSEVFDEKCFKLENPDLYKKYLITKNGTRRFLVKDKG